MRFARCITLPNIARGKARHTRAQKPGLWVRGIFRRVTVAVDVRAKGIGEVMDGGE